MGIRDRLRRRTPEQAFTAEVAALVRRTPGVAGVEPGDDALSLRVVGSGPFGGGVMSLTNLFLEVRGFSDRDRRAAIVRFVEAMTRQNRVPDDWDRARPRLLPAVRAAGFLGQLAYRRLAHVAIRMHRAQLRSERAAARSLGQAVDVLGADEVPVGEPLRYRERPAAMLAVDPGVHPPRLAPHPAVELAEAGSGPVQIGPG